MRRRNLAGLGDLLPAGSSLVYSATWNEPGYFGPTSSIAASQVAGQLASFGIVVDKPSSLGWLTPGNGFTLAIHTTTDYGAAADVQSIIDNAVYTVTGYMPQSSIATSALAAPAAAAATTASATQLSQAVQNYNDAQAAGDTASAAVWLAQIQSLSAPSAGSSALTWIENNALLVGGGILAFFLIQRFA
jgi:hypothetical protein